MKLNFWKHLLIVALFVGSLAAVQAQPKIGTVDLKKVFDGYFKTKQADTTLKERAGDFEKTRKGMLDDYQSLNERYKNDLTDDILKQLNANAPADSLKSSDSKDKTGDAKEEKK